MNDILSQIYFHKLKEVRNIKKSRHLSEICKEIKCKEKKPKDFILALKNKIDQGLNALICEVKKSSPSKGIIRKDFNPVEIAKIYENSGAACISVLTDEKYFLGKNEYLIEIGKNINIPIIRKDFIVDEYQIYESKMLGADCILLIVAMLDDEKLQKLENCALNIGLSVLIEIHDEVELKRALKLKSKLIGINNRNLKNFEVDIQNSIRLSTIIPKDYTIVSESGISNLKDINILKDFGINSFLIGEYFMRQEDIKKAVLEFN